MTTWDWPRTAGEAYFIAEAGVNHNGDVEVAKRLADAASDAGADAVKFQTFQADALVTDSAPTAEYQEDAVGSDTQRELLAALELDRDAHEELRRYCEEHGIEFLSTPFGRETASILADLDVSAFKIGSGDLTNHPLLRHVAEYDRPMIVSTGMSTLSEVREAFEAIRAANPTVPVALLHCVSAYPTAVDDVNLRAIRTLDDEFAVPVGFSDHTTAVEMPALSVAAGARIVEKHFTLDRSMEGPDHAASLEPSELDRAVSLVRDAARSLGDGVKRPVSAEAETREVARKGLYASSDLRSGDVLTADDVAIKRPAEGLAPSEYDRVIGRTLASDVSAESPLTAAHFEDR
jgi:N-acetylneuraminate synthase/N,N'-diacetyllegionaminate synthase